MRVLTCFVEGCESHLTPRFLDSLGVFEDIPVDIVELPPGDEHAYREILAHYWRLGETFLVLEPDVIPRPDVVEAFRNCPCEYGCFPYAWLTDVGPALGCTWFRDTFLHRYRDAVQKVGPVSWRQLDTVLMRHVLARKYFEQPHVHLPAVEHANPKKQLLDGACALPLMEVPQW